MNTRTVSSWAVCACGLLLGPAAWPRRSSKAQAPPPAPAATSPGQEAGKPSLTPVLKEATVRYRITDLGTLGGSRSEAFGINNKGQVVGASGFGATWEAVLFTDGKIIELGVLPHRYRSEAHGINSQGDIVGWSGEGHVYNSPTSHAFLYREHTMVDLNTFVQPDCGWVLCKANSINDLGQIVGWGVHRGKRRAFLFSPLATK